MSFVRKVLGGVGGGDGREPSIPELLFREFTAGRIHLDEYQTGTAVWVGDNTHTYAARPYPRLAGTVLDYVQARLDGKRDARDPSYHRRVGLWTFAISSLLEQNTADHSLLAWCLDLCRRKGLTRHAETISGRLAEFNLTIPPELEAALACQKKDAEEKQREEKRRA